MTCLTFTIVNKPEGWFVKGHDWMGPFACREHAQLLVDGMSSALRSHGEAVTVALVDRGGSNLPT